MKRSKFSEAQVSFILRQVDEGATVGEVCRKAGISEETFYVWPKKYTGLMPSEMKRLRQLEDENARLKRIVADLSLDKEMLQDVIKRKLWDLPDAASSWTICERPGRSASGAPVGRSRRNDPVITTRASGPIRSP
jgi:putative transposase